LKHCHDRKILHRDLKCENIYLTSYDGVKLGDFGVSFAQEKTDAKAITRTGTPYYHSPEMIKGAPYGAENDIWCLGVILYELCILEPPFQGKAVDDLYANVMDLKFVKLIPERFSENIKYLIENLLVIDQKKRLTINQILKEVPFIHEYA